MSKMSGEIKNLKKDLSYIKAKADESGTKFSIFHHEDNKPFLEHVLTQFNVNYIESKNIMLSNDELGLHNLLSEIETYIKNPRGSELLGTFTLFNIINEERISFLSNFKSEIKTFLEKRIDKKLGSRIYTLFKNHQDNKFPFTQLWEILQKPLESDLYSALQRYVKNRKLVEEKSRITIKDKPYKFSRYALAEDEKQRILELEEERKKRAQQRREKIRGVGKKVIVEALNILEWASTEEIVLYLAEMYPDKAQKYNKSYVKTTLKRLMNDNNIIKKGIDDNDFVRYTRSKEAKEVKIVPHINVSINIDNILFESKYIYEEIPLNFFQYDKVIQTKSKKLLFVNLSIGSYIYSVYYTEYNELGGILHVLNTEFKEGLENGDYEIRFPNRKEYTYLLKYLRENDYLDEKEFYNIKAREFPIE